MIACVKGTKKIPSGLMTGTLLFNSQERKHLLQEAKGFISPKKNGVVLVYFGWRAFPWWQMINGSIPASA